MANNFKNQADDLKPREKMMRAASLRDVDSEDLLAVLLKTGTSGCDVMELSRRLITIFGSIHEFTRVAIDWRAMKERIRVANQEHPERKISGVGDVKLLELAAATELARRGFAQRFDDEDAPPKNVRTIPDAVRFFRSALVGRSEQENFFVLPIDTRFVPACEPICLTRGTLSSTPAHPREVFREAIRWGAHAIMVAHNHPSGDPTPSREDIALTSRLIEASRLVSIPLVDHIVLGSSQYSKGYISLRESGLVEF